MKTNLKEFAINKKLPEFITNSNSFKKIEFVDKIFPKIGLPNCNQDVEITDTTAYISAVQLVEAISANINATFKYFAFNAGYKDFSVLICNISKQINYWNHSLLITKGEKITIALYEDILDFQNNLVFKKGQSIFSFYEKFCKMLLDIKDVDVLVSVYNKIELLHEIPEFKRFSSDNINAKDFKIVFSSDGEDGLFDIATMSMRGIYSCQSWEGEQRNRLVGSIVDPFTAIIYISNGSKYNEYGSKMVRRCLVRFVVNSKTDKPYLLLDKMYPEHSEEVYNKLASFLKEKTDNKFQIISCMQASEDYYVPNAACYSLLEDGFYSYQDSRILYKDDLPPTQKIKDKAFASTRFKNILKKSAFSYFENSEINYYKNVDNKILNPKSKLKQQLLATPDIKFIVRDIYKKIAEETAKNCNWFSNGETRLDLNKLICYNYLLNKEKIQDNVRKEFVKYVNNYYSIKEFNRKTLDSILKSIDKEVDIAVKTELKRVIKKRSKPLRLPT